MRYEPAIDGLRAVAIIAVVLFHVAPSAVPGGFLGVDVFFVISGYLITGLLAGEWKATGGISLSAFYARRVRRLAPAYFIVILAVLAAGTFLLPPTGERQALATSAAMSTVFLANVHFWRQTGYFADTAEWLPLLHLWTLAVEEQFYLAWPIAIIALGKAARMWTLDFRSSLRAAMLLAAAVSFALCLWALERRQGAAFFLMPTRVWEFAIGGWLAVSIGDGAARPSSRVVGLLAAVAVIASFALLDSKGHPGLPTLLPVVGAAAWIFTAQREPDSHAVRFLRLKPMVLVGRLSYSWYLWHWPLLAFARGARLGERDLAADLACAFASLGLAALTYRWIEDPVRRRRVRAFGTDRAALAAGAALLATGVAASMGSLEQARRAVDADPRLRAIADAKSSQVQWPAACNNTLRPIVSLAPLSQCHVGPAQGRDAIFVWGDSHAYHLLPALEAGGIRNGATVFARVMFTCPPILGVDAIDAGARADCERFRGDVLAEVRSLGGRISSIVVAARWLALPGGPQAWGAALERTLGELSAGGVPILVVGAMPEFRYRVPECVAQGRHDCSMLSAQAAASLDDVDAALRSIVSRMPNVRMWSPRSALCEGTACRVEDATHVYYHDSNHLSDAGARKIAVALWANLPGVR